MNTRFRQVFAPLVQGLLFLAFLAGLNLMGWDKSIPCVIAATILSVTVAYQVWPSSPVTLALTMILVSVVLPLSALYVVANWGESQAPFWGIVNMVDWRRTFLPTITAVVASVSLRFWMRRRGPPAKIFMVLTNAWTKKCRENRLIGVRMLRSMLARGNAPRLRGWTWSDAATEASLFGSALRGRELVKDRLNEGVNGEGDQAEGHDEQEDRAERLS